MAKTLAHQKRGICIECNLPHGRDMRAYRCWPCTHKVVALQLSASQQVKKAVVSGALKPARDCACVDCGGPAIEYEHRDYSRPLDVEPICRSCNLMRGPAKSSSLASVSTLKGREFPPAASAVAGGGLSTSVDADQVRHGSQSLFFADR